MATASSGTTSGMAMPAVHKPVYYSDKQNHSHSPPRRSYREPARADGRPEQPQKACLSVGAAAVHVLHMRLRLPDHHRVF